MCWEGKYKIIKAKEDIPCFKVCIKKHGLPVGYFTNFVYELNKEYKTTIEPNKSYLNRFFRKLLLNKNDTIRIGKGFHSYSMECRTDYTYNTISIFVYNKEGCYIGCYERNSKIVLAKCIIPKGSKYLINCDGEIVSNRIIINSIDKI